MITVIILWDNEIEKLEKTLESLPKRGGTAIRVSVWNPAGTSMPETLLKKYPDILPGRKYNDCIWRCDGSAGRRIL